MSILSHFSFLGRISFLLFNKVILIQCTKLDNKVDNANSLQITVAIISLMGGKDASSSLSESLDSVK